MSPRELLKVKRQAKQARYSPINKIQQQIVIINSCLPMGIYITRETNEDIFVTTQTIHFPNELCYL